MYSSTLLHKVSLCTVARVDPVCVDVYRVAAALPPPGDGQPLGAPRLRRAAYGADMQDLQHLHQ